MLRDTIDRGRSLDRAMQDQLARLQDELKPPLKEMAFGGCRYYHLLDGLLSELLAKPIRNKDRIVHFLLIVGLYQLRFMRTPDHAAVNQTVKALAASKQSWAKGLVNGVLRNYLRRFDNQALESTSLGVEQRASFSVFLYQEILQAWPEHADAIYTASIQRPPLTLRVNRQKTTRQEYVKTLIEREIDSEITLDSAQGITLKMPRPVEDLPMFAEGWVSVQDESAQLCTDALKLGPGIRVLDACAAPGGKTCAILEAEPDILLSAVDLPERVESIRSNLKRIGQTATIHDQGMESVEQWWDGKPFDRILLDVPCSGTGVIRRHPDILHHRQSGDIERFAQQQQALMALAWPLLAQGGKMLYVTCSIMPMENDQVIEHFLNNNTDAAADPLTIPGALQTSYGNQRLQGVHNGDGFYYCRLAKL